MTTTIINTNSNSTSGIKLTGDDILNVLTSGTLTDTDKEAVKWNLGTGQGAGTGITLNNAGTIISPGGRVVDQTSGPTPAGETSFTLNNTSPPALLSAYKDAFRVQYGTDGGSIVVTNAGTISAGAGNPSTGNRDFDIEEYAKVGNVTGFSTFALTNLTTGTLEATDDAIRVTTNTSNADPTQNPVFTGFITVDNLGIIQSTGVNVGGTFSSGQAIDFDNVNATTPGHIIITNGSLGDANAFIISADNDAIRPGNNGTVLNYGTIEGNEVFTSAETTNPDFQAGDDGISADTNETITVFNYAGGLIEGSKSGVFGSRDETATSAPVISSDILVTNAGTIIGEDGKGVGADYGSITNSGTIIGEDNTALLRGDGDGIDVNFTVNVTNTATGLIEGLASEGVDDNGRMNVADGIGIGGGTVDNAGTIYSGNNAVTVNDDSNPDGSRSGNADLVLTNEASGVIIAEDGYAIRSENKAGADQSNLPAVDYDTVVNYGTIISYGTIPDFSGTFEVTTYNTAAPYVATLTPDPNVIGTIEGQSSFAAGSIRFTEGDGSAIQLGEGNDILTDYGTIIATDGKAINLEGGNNTLNLYAGADISGLIDGGLGGTNTLNLFTPNGLGNSPAATTGTLDGIIDFQSLNIAAGTWTLEDLETFAGGVSIAAGASLIIGAAGTLVSEGLAGNFSFSGSGGALELQGGTVPAGTISGFGPGDTIELAGVAYAPASGDYYTVATAGTLTVDAGGQDYNFLIAGARVGETDFVVAGDFAITSDAPCYASGTLIRMASGAQIAVENLATGDVVATLDGTGSRVVWLGHRAIECARHPKPELVWPVLIRRDAFADGLPARDLFVSPGHSVHVDGMLMQAEKLLNGATILRVPVPRVEYWHVELARHDIIFAEGLPAESYLDTGNRGNFINGGGFIAAYPDFRPKHWAETCLPLVFEGPEMEAAKTALLAQASALGHNITQEDDLHIMADGKRFEPVRLNAGRAAFLLPPDCETINLMSRTFIPAQMNPKSGDGRKLGIRVGRLQLDGTEIALADDAAFGPGWHYHEPREAAPGARWTNGAARLRAGSRLVVIDLAGKGFYWETAANLIALFGSAGRI